MPKTVPQHTIEFMTTMEADEVAKLDAVACTYYDEDFECDVVHSHAWKENEVLAFIKAQDTLAFCCRDNRDALVGYVAFTINPRAYHIVGLVVHPSHRRKGYGTALLSRVWKSLMKNGSAKVIVIHLREKDRSSQEFFKKHGFRSRVVRDYFVDGEDAYRFSFIEAPTPLTSSTADDMLAKE